MPIELTTQQKQARAEISRLNGAKSRGPRTLQGKFRSSMNAIATGQHLQSRAADLPSWVALLSADDITAYRTLFQDLLRQVEPDSEFELTLLRQMTAEMFRARQIDLLLNLAMQDEIDDSVRKYHDMSMDRHYLRAYKSAAVADAKFRREAMREKKDRLAAFNHLYRSLKAFRKDFPMIPPEPLSIAAEDQLEESLLPTPEVVADILALADRAKNEPGFELPHYVAKFLSSEWLMQKLAPHYNLGNLLERFASDALPEAA